MQGEHTIRIVINDDQMVTKNVTLNSLTDEMSLSL